MKILRGEVSLRDETRELEQSRIQLAEDTFDEKAIQLAETQEELGEELFEAIEMIRDLPDGESKFGKELNQLNNAGKAMADATDILSAPDTGSKAVAAETEAIEWLLQAKRSKGGGGGGGNNAGNGSRQGGVSNVAALALLGEANDSEAKVVKRDSQQTLGKAGETYPTEYQRGLDAYFEMLEKSDGAKQ